MKKIKLIVLFLAVCFGYENGYSHPIEDINSEDINSINSLVSSDTVIYLKNIRLDKFDAPSKEKFKYIDDTLSPENVSIFETEIAFVTCVIPPTQCNFQKFDDTFPPDFFWDRRVQKGVYELLYYVGKYISIVRCYNTQFEKLFTPGWAYRHLRQDNSISSSFWKKGGENLDFAYCFNESLKKIEKVREELNSIVLCFYNKFSIKKGCNIPDGVKVFKKNDQLFREISEDEMHTWSELKVRRDIILKELDAENKRFNENVQKLDEIKGMPSQQLILFLSYFLVHFFAS